MNTEVMHMTTEASEAGKLRFPEVVKALSEVGVESYHSDLISGVKTFYMPNGESYEERLAMKPGEIAEKFSENALVAAIRAAQKDEILYPEFLKRAAAAGAAAYRVFITGRRAVYIGRKGEIHVEEFPQAKSQD
jgi:uncharacterized protein YbcV (DUF1398 family)